VQQQPALRAATPDSQRVVARALRTRQRHQRLAVDPRAQDQLGLPSGHRACPNRPREQCLDVTVDLRGRGGQWVRPDVEFSAVAPGAAVRCHRVVHAVEQDVGRDPARSAIDWVLADALPRRRQQRGPQLFLVARVDQQPRRQALEAGRTSLAAPTSSRAIETSARSTASWRSPGVERRRKRSTAAASGKGRSAGSAACHR
jgi:hypothetical protein